MAASGLIVPGGIVANTPGFTRFDGPGDKPGRANGFYLLRTGEWPVGWYGDWKQQFEESWSFHDKRSLSAADRNALNREQNRIRRELADAKSLRWAEVAEDATRLWNAAGTAAIDPRSHPYVVAKQIDPRGLRTHMARDGTALVAVPMYAFDKDGKALLQSLQMIDTIGAKRFLKAGRVEGCFFPIKGSDERIVICEGVATAATIWEATGFTAVAAFNAGNLVHVAKSFELHRRKAELIIAADDDKHLPRDWRERSQGRPWVNVGVIKGKAAADGRARLVLPAFADDSTAPTDFNDLARLEGLAVVKAQIASVASTPKALAMPLINPAIWEGRPVPPRVYAWADRMPFRQATGVYGGGATGKSLLLQQAATCSALGKALLGVPMRQAVAIYLTCEDDADELHRRQVAICAALDVPLSALSGRLHLISLAGEVGNTLALFDASGAMLTTPAWDRLLATALATDAGFIGLDNAAHLFGGNENDRAHVAAFIGLLNRLAIVANAAVPFLSHPNKAGAEYSGSTAWENQVRSRLTLDYRRDDAGEIVDLDARTLTIGKANYSRRGQPLQFRWHNWAFVLPEDLPPDYRAEIAANIQAAGENTKFLACLAKATAERRAVSASSTASNYAPRVFATMPVGKACTAKGYEAALHRLLHLGVIRNGERVYQRDNRSWVTGLALAPTLAPTPAPRSHQPCTEPHSDTELSGCTNLHALTPLYTTYKSGADLGLPPPDENDQIDDRSDRPK